jgi:hypothetical protein
MATVSSAKERKFRDMINAARDVQMYITPNGEYGEASGLRLFRHGYLNLDEWIRVENELDDESIYEYISAILDGNMDKKREIENESN